MESPRLLEHVGPALPDGRAAEALVAIIEGDGLHLGEASHGRVEGDAQGAAGQRARAIDSACVQLARMAHADVAVQLAAAVAELREVLRRRAADPRRRSRLGREGARKERGMVSAFADAHHVGGGILVDDVPSIVQ